MLPEAAAGRFSATKARGLGLDGRVETRNVDKRTVDRVTEALAPLKPSLAGFGYTIEFNPETLVHVVTDAPSGSFAAVDEAFPGRISITRGTLEHTAGSWTDDQSPHWGGAYLDGALLCTSGFAIKNASGTRWMVTAGLQPERDEHEHGHRPA